MSNASALIAAEDFAEFTQLITAARQRAVQAVNTTLIDLYWEVGQRISQKTASSQWGDGVVAQLAQHLAQTQPGLRGFTRANLFRMRQFYEAYAGHETVAPLVRRLPWTHHLIILSQSKHPQEQEFYVRTQPHLVASPDCPIPHRIARQSTATSQTASVLPTKRPRSADGG